MTARTARGRGDATPPLSETVFQRRVMEAARLYGWQVVHYRKARRRDGEIRTPVQGHKGGPDLLLAKNGRVLLVELKSDTGRMTAEQRVWAAAIGPELHRLWRPRDWDAVLAELSA